MIQKDKELLLKDLGARLSYRVKGIVYAEVTNGEYDINGDMIFFDTKFNVELDSINTSTEEIHVVAIGNEDTVSFIEEQQENGKPYIIDEFKPYLRPMSSMTEEEKNEWVSLMRKEYREQYPYSAVDSSYYEYFPTIESFDYLNSHHFDMRNLIEKKLALEAPEDMYK